MRFTALILISAISLSAISQKTEIDSLISLTETTENDSIKVIAFQQLAWNLKYSDPATSMLYIDSAVNLSGSLDSKMLGNSYYYKAIIYYLTGDFENGISTAQKALANFLDADHEYGQASIYNLLGLIKNRIGAFEEAIASYHLSLELAEKGDNLYAISNPYHNIALIYSDTKDYERALDYANKALEVRFQIGDSSFIAQSYQTIGGILWHLKKLDQAETYLLDSERIFQNAGDLNSLSITYTNLGLLYRDRKKLEESSELFEKAAEISTQLEDNENLVNALINQSGNQLELKNTDKALALAHKASEISRKSGLLPSYKESLEMLSDIYEEKKQFTEAFKYSKELISVSDSLLNIERASQIENLEVTFNVSKKEQQIALQKAEIAENEAQLSRNRIIIFAAFILIVLIVALALLQRSRLKKKQQLKLQAADLLAKKAEINATISSQEKERARYARDLHDGFGQMISILNLNLKNLKEGAKPDERHQVFEASSQVIDEMYEELKNICFDLMPQTLIKSGLKNALVEFAGRVNQAGKVSIEVNVFGLDERLKEVQEISLFRISQEWINNVLKYSDADKVTLQITRDEQEITLLIEDNGSGFDRTLLTSGKGNGWKNLNTRTNILQGKLELETNPEARGNTLIVNAPIALKTDDSTIENTVKMV